MFKIIKILISSFPFLPFTETISFGFGFTVLQVHSKKSLCIFIKTKTQHTPQQKKTKKVLNRRRKKKMDVCVWWWCVVINNKNE
jgi:hypothetical protein